MFVHLAAYGTLMTGETNTLAPTVRQRMHSAGPCRIPGRLYRVRNPGSFDYPALIPMPGHTARGELFKLPADDLSAIDAYDGFRPASPESSTYLRRNLTVQTASGAERAWVYIWNQSTRGLTPIRGNAWA